MTNGPSKAVAVYAPTWNTKDFSTISTNYNVILPFAATPSSGGTLSWGGGATGIQTARKRGQTVIISCGGAGAGVVFTSRSISQAFVNSFIKIADSLGGVDGIDFNTFEANATPNYTEYAWIVDQLRAKYGSGFIATAPPAPWNETDKSFCAKMVAAGKLDWVAPQFYDGPGLADTNYVVSTVKEWVGSVGGGDASKIMVGLGTMALPNYETVTQVKDIMTQISKAYPSIRGAFNWERSADPSGTAFAATVKGVIGSSTTTPPPVTPPPTKDPVGTYTVASGDTLSSIGTKLGIDWNKLAEWNKLSDPYSLEVGQKLTVIAPTTPPPVTPPTTTNPLIVPKGSTLATLIKAHNALVEKLKA